MVFCLSTFDTHDTFVVQLNFVVKADRMLRWRRSIFCHRCFTGKFIIKHLSALYGRKYSKMSHFCISASANFNVISPYLETLSSFRSSDCAHVSVATNIQRLVTRKVNTPPPPDSFRLLSLSYAEYTMIHWFIHRFHFVMVSCPPELNRHARSFACRASYFSYFPLSVHVIYQSCDMRNGQVNNWGSEQHPSIRTCISSIRTEQNPLKPQ